MGVKLLSEAQTEKFAAAEKADFTVELYCGGYPAAVDLASKTVYISQNITETTHYRDLESSLVAKDGGYTRKTV